MEPRKLTYIDWWQKGEAVKPSTERESNAPTLPMNDISEGKNASGANYGAPYVQPLVIVPYVSTEQPMYYYNTAEDKTKEVDNTKYYEDLFDDEESYALDDERAYSTSKKALKIEKKELKAQGSAVKGKRKANVFAIISFILGAIYIAALFNFEKLIKGFNYNVMYEGKTGFDVVMGLVEEIKGGTFAFDANTSLLPLLVTVGAALVVVLTVFSLITVAMRTNVFVKILAAIAFVVNVGAAVVAFVVVKIPFETYGLAIEAGIALIMFVLTIAARGKKRK